MSENIIAPIQVTDIFVVASNFKIDQYPAENMDLKMDINYRVLQLIRADGVGSAALELMVDGGLIDKEGTHDEKMHAGVTVHISVSSNLSDEMPDADARQYLLSNAISIAYGHSKSYVMMMTGLSPMGSLTLPAILPTELAADNETPFKTS